MNVDLLLDRYTIILSDSGRGRTKYTSEIVRELIRRGLDDRIYIIDLAPQSKGVGMRLSKFIYGFKNAIYRYSREIQVPNISSDPSAMNRVLEKNVRVAEEFFNDFMSSDRDILVVNDLYIYLLGSELDNFLRYLRKAKTFIGNTFLGGEEAPIFVAYDPMHRRRTEALIKHMHNVVKV